MPYSNIDATISDAQLDGILQSIAQIANQLPFLVNLTPRERQSLRGLGASDHPFLSNSLAIADNNPQIVPPYIDLPAVERDYQLALRLETIATQLGSLHEKITDTAIAAGSEAFQGGLAIYQTVKDAAKSGTPGTDAFAEELGKRFLRRTRSKPAADPAPPAGG